MPQITFRKSLAAGEVVDNVWDKSQWEFMPYPALLEFAFVGDANSHEVLLDCYSGQDVLAEACPISSAARFPVYPDDFMLNDVAAGGDRIKSRLRNTGAGAHVVQSVLKITPA